MISRTRRIALLGWYGEGAKGDDLMGRITKRLLAAEGALRGWDLEWVDLQRAELVVVGGGTIIGVDSMEVVDQLALTSAPVVIFGSGFRREQRDIGQENREKTRHIFSRARLRGVRGYLSQQFLIHNGIEDVEVIGDPAIPFRAVPVAPPPGSFKVGISVRCMSKTGEPQYATNEAVFERLADICDALVEQYGATLYFFNFAENVHDSDAEGIQGILRAMRHPPQSASVFDQGGPEQMFSLLGHMDYIVSQRLHPTILGWVQGIPHIALDYQFDKTADFMSTLGMTEFVLRTDVLRTDTYLAYMRRMMAERDIIRKHALASAAYWSRVQHFFARRCLDLLPV